MEPGGEEEFLEWMGRVHSWEEYRRLAESMQERRSVESHACTSAPITSFCCFMAPVGKREKRLERFLKQFSERKITETEELFLTSYVAITTPDITSLQGDVRVSLGGEGEPQIGKQWIAASAGMPVEEGYTLATEAGSAEIALENGSVIYLGPHSLLMFHQLETTSLKKADSEDFDTVRVKLLTGSAMVLSQFRYDGEFVVQTQTAYIRSDGPALMRITSYLNSTEVVDLGQTLPKELTTMTVSAVPSIWRHGTFAVGEVSVTGP